MAVGDEWHVDEKEQNIYVVCYTSLRSARNDIPFQKIHVKIHPRVELCFPKPF